jgi:uncharacterized protein (DUF1499 family)
MKWLALVLALPFLLVIVGLLLNRPPLFSPPGPAERLKTYFTTNIAATRTDHPFPELRSPTLAAGPGEAEDAVLEAMSSLGWRDIGTADGEIRAVVVSSLFRFRDDVTVRLEKVSTGTLVHARSASRVGKGDLAANARHLSVLFAKLDALVDEDGRSRNDSDSGGGS